MQLIMKFSCGNFFIFMMNALCVSNACFSQPIDLGIKNFKTSVESPYRLDLKKDLIVSGTALALIATGYGLHGLQTPLDSTDLLFPDISVIPSFDVSAIHQYDNAFVATSDVLLYTSMAMPFIAFFDKRVKGHAPQVIAMYLETIALTQGIHSMVSSISSRRRPYTFNTDSVVNSEGFKEPEVSFEAKTKKGNQSSFFSGHTSTAAAATFFGARVFTDFRPQSKMVPFVWIAAATVPAFTGFARYKAGNHFPSDVVTGYVVGAAIGYLVPTLHKFKGNNLSLMPWYNGQGFAIEYTF